MKEFDPQVATRLITVKLETVCSRCGRQVLKGEEAVWNSYHTTKEELRPKRRIVCRACQLPQRRSAGVSSNPAKRTKPGEGKSFRAYLKEKEQVKP